MEKLLTIDQVAEILGVSKRTVAYTINLPCIKVANKRMYTTKDLENFLQRNRVYNIDIKPRKRQEFVS